MSFKVTFGFIFAGYDNFVIEMADGNNVEEWFMARDSMSNFDKVSFKSEQPKQNIPFLTAFLETQAFATYIDEKLRSKTKNNSIDGNTTLNRNSFISQ